MISQNSRPSTLRRGDQIFVIAAHAAGNAELNLWAMYQEGAFVQWEDAGVTLSDGQRVGPCYVLWVPAPELLLAEAPALPPPEPAADAAPAKAARRGKTTRHKGITRIDHPAKRTFGYMVRVAWKGEIHHKFFSDKRCGDRLAALDAAIQWRDRTEVEIGKPRTERMVFGKPAGSNPAVGVARRRENNTDYYEATWLSPEGRVQRTRYSIRKHGERKALRLAMAARQRHERIRYQTPRD